MAVNADVAEGVGRDPIWKGGGSEGAWEERSARSGGWAAVGRWWTPVDRWWMIGR